MGDKASKPSPSTRTYFEQPRPKPATPKPTMLETPWRETEEWNDESPSTRTYFEQPRPKSVTPKPTMLETPWRETEEWNDETRKNLYEEVNTFIPPEVERSKILIVGSINAGKSSFFNTVSAVFQNRYSQRASVGTELHSVTGTYTEYKVIKDVNSKPLNFILCDTRGVEGAFGFSDLEFDYLVEGNLQNGYKFDTDSRRTSGFNIQPTLKDRVHCVCFVFDSTAFDMLEPTTISRFKTFVTMLHRKSLPHVVLLSKVDLLDPEIQIDLSKVYKSIKIKTVVDDVSSLLGVPKGLIMPVKNYNEAHELKTNTDILALLAMRQMLRASEDFLFNHMS